MSKVVGEVAIEVGADIGPLVKEMTRAKGVMSGLGRAADKIGSGFDRFGTRATDLGKKLSIVSAAIAAVTAGAVALVKSAADVGDKIGNSAKAVGMGAEAYQEYAFAIGEAADITQDEFDSAMVIMNRRLGEAQAGSKSAAEAFGAIGIKAEDVAAGLVSSEDVLAAWVKTVEASDDSAAAAAMSADLFGKKGAVMGSMLAGSQGQVAGFIDRARELGLVVSDEFVAASGVFNDRMAELGKQFEMVKIKIAEVLLPVIIDKLIPALQDVVIPAVVSVVEKIGEWITWFGQLDPAIQSVVGAITGAFAVGGPVLLAIGAVSMAISTMIAATGPIGLMITAASLLAAAWVTWGDDFKAVIGGAIDWVTGKFNALMELINRIVETLKAWGQAAKDFLNVQPAGAGGFEPDYLGSTPQGSGMINPGGGGAGGALGGQMMGASIVNGMVLGATNAINEKREALASIFAQVPQIARDVLGIHSPSTVFAEIGTNMGAGMAQGISDSSAMVGDAVKGMTGAAVGAANEGVAGVLTAMGGLFEGSKKISAGIALANSWLAFTEVLKDPSFVGRPWARFAAAIAALKPGLQAVKNIQSARPGGGGATGVGTSPAAAAPSAPQGIANITLVGDSFSRGTVESLFKQINDGQRMGYRINLVNG